MRKKIIICIVVVFFIALICVNKYLLEKIPREARTDLPYCEEIAKEINTIGAKQMECIDVEEVDDGVRFWFMVKDAGGYNEDECMKDLILYRNYVIDYLDNNIYHELNNKKIQLVFQTIAGRMMSVYNYNFDAKGELENATDFAYYSSLEMENLSTMSELSDAKIMSVGTRKVDTVEFFAEWNNLEYIYFVSYMSDKDIRNRIRELLPNCVVKFAQEE